MDAVGDRVNRIAREETVRDFAVLHGHTIDKARSAQRQLRHVQAVVMATGLQPRAPSITQHTMGQVGRKLIVTGRDRRMGRKDTLFPDSIDEISGNRFLMNTGRQFLFKQSKHEQGRMPFIHMKPADVAVSERQQHAVPPNPNTTSWQSR